MTWTVTPALSAASQGRAIAVSLQDENIIYIGGRIYSGKAAVLRSTDGGLHWTNISKGIIGNWVTDLEIDPRNSNVVYASGYRFLYKTTNAGQSWEEVLSGETSRVIINPLSPNDVYVAYEGAVLWSRDGGKSWDPISGGFDRAGIRDLVIDPSSRLLYAGTIGGGIYRYHPPPWVILRAPNLESPADGAIRQDTALTLRWEDTNNLPQEIRYELRIKRAGGKYSYYPLRKNAESYPLKGLELGQSYFWNVRAKGNGKSTKDSPWANDNDDWTFSTQR